MTASTKERSPEEARLIVNNYTKALAELLIKDYKAQDPRLFGHGHVITLSVAHGQLESRLLAMGAPCMQIDAEVQSINSSGKGWTKVCETNAAQTGVFYRTSYLEERLAKEFPNHVMQSFRCSVKSGVISVQLQSKKSFDDGIDKDRMHEKLPTYMEAVKKGKSLWARFVVK